MISIAKVNDVDRIYSLSSSLITDPQLSKDDILRYVDDKNILMLVLQDGEMIIGYSIIRLSIDEAEIDEIGIDKNYQGKGYGKTLLKEVEHQLYQRGIKRVLLEVREKNLTAISLYKKSGYQIYKRREKYYLDDNALCMHKEIKDEG